VYVDGYNLYHGCLKGTQFKWLDLLTLFEKHVLPSVMATNNGRPSTSCLEPVAIKYFTAKILESAAKAPDSVSSQARYHTALKKLYGDRIELIEGYYALNRMKVKIVDAEDPDRPPKDCQEIQAWKLEEKQSDVNLALHAYHDAVTGGVDQVVIVTNDTDIAPALEMIRAHTRVSIGLVVPTTDHQRHPNADLAKLAHWTRTHVTMAELAGSQLPRVIPGRKPTIKLESWYPNPEKLARILDLAIPVRGSRGAAFKWLGQENSHFDGRIPLDMLETEQGADEILAYIHRWIAERAPTLNGSGQ
jgi:6-hydroxy-3-succinoylpyridine 3-monooxygenase